MRGDGGARERRGGSPPGREDEPGAADSGSGAAGVDGYGYGYGYGGEGDAGGGGLREALLGLLGGAERQDGGPRADDLADVLWMARLTGPGSPGAAGEGDGDGGGREPRGDGPERPVTRVARDRRPEAPRVPPASGRPGTGPRTTAEPTVGLYPMRPDAGPARAGSGAGHVVRVTRPPALTGALDLARALRPMRRSVDSPGPALLDEEATAQATGEAGRLIPVWRPPSERRFCVDLLVDTGATMAVWHGLAAELCTVLERHGAFADVRCWSLDTDRPLPRLSAFRRRHTGAGPAKPLRWPGPLEDPSGRRVLLVLTDGVGPAWYGDALPDFLGRVTAERPAAALQVLPRRLWHRTALRAFPVELRVRGAARPVPEVRPQVPLPGHLRPSGERHGAAARPPAGTPGTGPGEAHPYPAGGTRHGAGGPGHPTAGPGGPPPVTGPRPGDPPGSERTRRAAPVRWLPVMEVDGRWLAPWAGLVAGRVPGWTPMLAAPVRGVSRPRRTPAAAPPAGAGERVARFRAGCSPRAFRLACHLAAAPLSLPVMRLVQQATMPRSGQTDLAEVFLSGIIERRDCADDPDEVVYDFVPGVRAELLAELTRTESLHVLEDVLTKVSGRVAATFGGTLDFRALAAPTNGTAGATGAALAANGTDRDPDLPPGRHLPETSLPFAEVAVAVLSGAGGHHRALAERLAAAAGGRIPLPGGVTAAAEVRPEVPASAPEPASGRTAARTPAVPRPRFLNAMPPGRPDVRSGPTEPGGGEPPLPVRPPRHLEPPPGTEAPELRWSGHELLWLITRTADGANGVSREALSLLAPHDHERVDDHVAREQLSRLPGGRLSSSHRTVAVTADSGLAGRCESRLVAVLHLVCPEPTADPATWAPYEVLEEGARPLPPVVLRWTRQSGEEREADLARTFVLRWIAYLLLRGRYLEAEDLIREAESSPMLFGDLSYGGGAARSRLGMAALRVHLARGTVTQARLRCERILAAEPTKSPRACEAHLARAHISRMTGDLAAARIQLSAAAGITEPDRRFALRLREERVRQRLTAGELSAAVRRLADARELLDAPADGADPATRTAARLAEGRHALLTAELRLVFDDLDSGFVVPAGERNGTPPERSAGAAGQRSAAGSEAAARPDPPVPAAAGRPDTVSGLEAARWRMWHTPSGRPESVDGFLASVPDEYAELYAALTERYVEALLVRETGGLWHASGGGPYSAPLSVMRTLEQLNSRLQTRARRTDLLARRFQLAGGLALAGGNITGAVSALESARAVVTDAYGPASPLLPRILLHLALARFSEGSRARVREAMDAAQGVLTRLYGPSTPHQDRVTALLARSRLARRVDEEQDAQARLAAAMRGELLRARPEM